MSVAEKMTALADAIREKTGETGKLSLDGMAEALRKLPGPIVATASGNPISLTDATDLKLRGLKLFGKTTQNGTPTQEAPVPLVSAGDGGSLGVTVAGKNLWPLGEELTVNVWVQKASLYLPKGTYKISGIATNNTTNSDFLGIVLKDENMQNLTWLNFPRSKNGERTSTTVELTKDCYNITIYADKQYVNGSVATYKDMQIEVGTTATEYEPYKELQTLPISTPNGLPGIPVTSGGNYTDETGQQWVCDEVDFGRGIYVQRIFGTVFKSAVGWNLAGTKNGLKRFYTNQFMGVIKNAKDDATKECALCSHFINVTASDTWNEVTGISVNSKGRLDIYYSGIEQTTAALEVYFSSNPVAFMAELATPIETPLSTEELAAYAALHTNYPNTTILNDGGAGMEVKYVADTKNYIDNQIAAVAAAIVNA